jgi:hypothetical protein
MTDPNGKIIDAPTEPERRVIKSLINEVAKHEGIKNYQAQSVLWFYEQRLFRELGAPSKSYGFSDGAVRYDEYTRGGGVGEEGVRGTAQEEGAKGLESAAPKISPQKGAKLSATGIYGGRPITSSWSAPINSALTNLNYNGRGGLGGVTLVAQLSVFFKVR